jgi:hypothetical protein
MSTNFAKEFKLYESLFEQHKRTRLTESTFSDCAVCGGTGHAESHYSASYKNANAVYVPFGRGIVHRGKCLSTLMSDPVKKRAIEFYDIALGATDASSFTQAEIDEMRKAWDDCCKAKLISDSSVQLNLQYHAKQFENNVAKVFTASGHKKAALQKQIADLQRQLHDEEVAEKKASYGNNLPAVVYIWDMYIDPKDKGTWLSAELYNGEYDGIVFETKDDAVSAGYTHLEELDDENELDGYPDDYSIDTVAVPVNQVSDETLEFSGLEHLI